jgi:hypothetical protein
MRNDCPSGRTGAKKDGSSDNSSMGKCGQTDRSFDEIPR